MEGYIRSSLSRMITKQQSPTFSRIYGHFGLELVMGIRASYWFGESALVLHRKKSNKLKRITASEKKVPA